jgi:hypothetical protein
LFIIIASYKHYHGDAANEKGSLGPVLRDYHVALSPSFDGINHRQKK